MIVNFKIYKISRGANKLTRIFIIIKKIAWGDTREEKRREVPKANRSVNGQCFAFLSYAQVDSDMDLTLTSFHFSLTQLLLFFTLLFSNLFFFFFFLGLREFKSAYDCSFITSAEARTRQELPGETNKNLGSYRQLLLFFTLLFSNLFFRIFFFKRIQERI